MGDLDILIWNVEHGSARYATTPNGRKILMHTGASTTFAPARHLSQHRGVERVDLFILSHADTDHLRDVENVDRLLSPACFDRNWGAPLRLKYPTYLPTTDPLNYFQAFDAHYNTPLGETSGL